MCAKHTCVFVEGEESRASSRHCAIGHPAIFPSVGIIGCYLDDRRSRSTVGTETDHIENWIEGGPIVINVHHWDPHTSHWAQATLGNKQMFKDCVLDWSLWFKTVEFRIARHEAQERMSSSIIGVDILVHFCSFSAQKPHSVCLLHCEKKQSRTFIWEKCENRFMCHHKDKAAVKKGRNMSSLLKIS